MRENVPESLKKLASNENIMKVEMVHGEEYMKLSDGSINAAKYKVTGSPKTVQEFAMKYPRLKVLPDIYNVGKTQEDITFLAVETLYEYRSY